jgi:oligoendopeptidase F
LSYIDSLTKEKELLKWEDISPCFEELINTDIKSKEDIEALIIKSGRLSAYIEEKFARAYINMTCDTENKEYSKVFNNLSGNISPKVEEAFFDFQSKLAKSPFFSKLDGRFSLVVRSIKNTLELYKENNLTLKAEADIISTQYDKITGSIMINYEGKELTLSQARKELESDDRQKRKELWSLISQKQFEHKDDIEAVFDRLFSVRNIIAKNAGFENFRDYIFKDKERFDYTPDDCFKFHDSVEKEIVPLVEEISLRHKIRLGVSDYRPFDVPGIPKGEEPLKPFASTDELVEKTIAVYTKIRPDLGENLKKMRDAKLFDLESRKGKAPGGYNYPLHMTNMPFIFMNAVGSQSDVRTIMHEAGHAMHNFQTANMEINDYKNTPSESAELASMSMELMTMDYWDIFYDNEADLKRAKREQIEGTITILPWIMVVDAFQHWCYENPEHTPTQREAYFLSLLNRFSDGLVNWDGYGKYRAMKWVYQLHITTVPFYYIEYAIAQLGALQIWKNYTQNKEAAVNGYLNALSLGSSKTLPEVYKAAGIRFDFSKDIIKELALFAGKELEKLG